MTRNYRGLFVNITLYIQSELIVVGGINGQGRAITGDFVLSPPYPPPLSTFEDIDDNFPSWSTDHPRLTSLSSSLCRVL